ncbi:HotDog domain-containing protein [Phlyctochytrium arcticum]|nr:HotDog domain-containing protein [Phlyctochytrium arcticum]
MSLFRKVISNAARPSIRASAGRRTLLGQLRTINSTVRPPNPSAGGSWRRTIPVLLVGALAGSAATYQLLPPENDSLTDASLEDDLAHEALLKAERDSHDYLNELRADPQWKEMDPYEYLSGGRLHRNFTAGTLKGKGKFALRPALFCNKDMTECVAILHVGERLSGHDKIVHGGVTATLMDEMLARAIITSLPNQTGFTANLNINYRRPVQTNQFIVLRSKLTKIEGRKGYGEASIKSLDGQQTFVEATALFISPNANLLSLASRFRPV